LAGYYGPLSGTLSVSSWDLDSRLAEIGKLFTPERVETVKRWANHYLVPAELLAAIILAEQKDQTYAENMTDLASCFWNDPSVGLGQVTVSTARALFPEELKDSFDATIAWKLSGDDFGIRAAAKALSKFIAEGEQYFGRATTVEEIGSRYTSSSYDGMRNSWGIIVRQSYDDILVSGLFGDQAPAGVLASFELYLEQGGVTE
jgi:hypothetical protein